MCFYAAWHKASMWIGGTDQVIENQWRWLETGTPINSGNTKWAPGQPDGADSANCVFMAYQVNNMTNNRELVWFDDRCNHPHGYICEKM